MGKKLTLFVLTGALLAGLVVYLCPCLLREPKVPAVPLHRWWGPGQEPAHASKSVIEHRPFRVEVKEEVLQDLKKRLANTRLTEPLEGTAFQYGFNTQHLRSVLQYWQTKYDWRKQEAVLNQFPQYLANIEGIDLHYLRVKPTGLDAKVRPLPLLMVHGWPGSVVEFYKIIPLLTKVQEKTGLVFEVICPSIPGYGFSEAPHHPGFSGVDAARLFTKLMTSLGHDKFYYQGGDWGGMIGSILSILYPERVTGLHLNMAMPRPGLMTGLKYLVGHFVPSLILDGDHQYNIFPFKDIFSQLMLESGYMHIQSTKPDTVGVAVGDSPAGLAAYILEKFSTWTDMDNRDKKDGGLLVKYNMDELLTNIMVYWVTNSFTSSARFYKENFNQEFRKLNLDSLPILVPSGLALFPNEIMTVPRSMMASRHRHIVTYTHMERGGHFAAFEEPELLADDFRKFVVATEEHLRAVAAKKAAKGDKKAPSKSAKQDQAKPGQEKKPTPEQPVPDKPVKATPTQAKATPEKAKAAKDQK